PEYRQLRSAHSRASSTPSSDRAVLRPRPASAGTAGAVHLPPPLGQQTDRTTSPRPAAAAIDGARAAGTGFRSRTPPAERRRPAPDTRRQAPFAPSGPAIPSRTPGRLSSVRAHPTPADPGRSDWLAPVGPRGPRAAA